MTDKEIVKAKKLLKKLEEAYNAYYDTSKGMPYDLDTTIRETAICLEHSIDEINRQKATIERLKELIDVLETDNINANMNLEHIQYEFDLLNQEKSAVIAEAIKEFAKRLKSTMFNEDFLLCEHCDMANIIDNLVKEMTEEEKK